MRVTDKGQVTIPKHIRTAAGVLPGSEVSFSLDGSKVVMIPVASGIRDDRRSKLLKAAVYTELLVPGPDVQSLDELLDVYDVQRSALPWACASLAAAAFRIHRSRGGARLRPLPEFFIGAHAAVANLNVLTRDPAGYASYFPRLAVHGPRSRAGMKASDRHRAS